MNGELLIDWPESQTCMDCSHGYFVGMDDRPSCYLCHFDNNTDVLETVPLNCPIYQTTEEVHNYGL